MRGSRVGPQNSPCLRASAHSVLTDWRRSPAHMHKSPDAQERVPPVGGRSDATRRGRRRYRARHPTCHSEAKSHNSHSLMRFHCVIKSLHRIYAITHEEAETKSNYSSYKKMDLIHQPLNGMRDFTSERFRREIAQVQEDVARMRERRRDMTETCGAYTSPASFRVARRAFPHVLWFWTGMGSRDFASERFRWEGCNLLR